MVWRFDEQLLQLAAIVLQGIGAIFSVFLAYLLYRMTDRITAGNTVRGLNESWHHFDGAMRIDENREVFNQFLSMTLTGAEAYLGKADKKIDYILYTYIDCLNNMYWAIRSQSVPRIYCVDSLRSSVSALYPRRDYVLPFMVANGYNAPFLEYVKARFAKLEKEERRANRGTMWSLRTLWPKLHKLKPQKVD